MFRNWTRALQSFEFKIFMIFYAFKFDVQIFRDRNLRYYRVTNVPQGWDWDDHLEFIWYFFFKSQYPTAVINFCLNKSVYTLKITCIQDITISSFVEENLNALLKFQSLLGNPVFTNSDYITPPAILLFPNFLNLSFFHNMSISGSWKYIWTGFCPNSTPLHLP